MRDAIAESRRVVSNYDSMCCNVQNVVTDMTFNLGSLSGFGTLVSLLEPRNRQELQGDGGAEKGVFGCIGACGRSLSVSSVSSVYKYCSSSANGPWESGNGVCVNAAPSWPLYKCLSPIRPTIKCYVSDLIYATS